MYAVVLYNDGVESSIGQPMRWSEAYADYETQAAFVNEKNLKGEYKRPKLRIAIRNLNQGAD